MADKTNWTPGPWAVVNRVKSWDWVVYSEKNPNDEICQPFHDGTEFNEIGEANAHLIAAAPELYEACMTGYTTLWAMKARLIAPRNETEKAAMDLLEQRMKVLESALKKARGESQ